MKALTDKIIEALEKRAYGQFNVTVRSEIERAIEEIKEIEKEAEFEEVARENLLKEFFNSKKESEWNLLYHDQQEQLEKEFADWYKENYNFEGKRYCMPDNVNTKEEHEQYLKDIGYEKKN